MSELLQGRGKRLTPHEQAYVEEVADILRAAHFIDKGWTLRQFEDHDPHFLDILRDVDGMKDRIRFPRTDPPQARK